METVMVLMIGALVSLASIPILKKQIEGEENENMFAYKKRSRTYWTKEVGKV